MFLVHFIRPASGPPSLMTRVAFDIILSSPISLSRCLLLYVSPGANRRLEG